MLSTKMLKALNEQICKEFYSEYFYLSMSSWCESNDLPGMAAFMKLKSEEERAHAMKLYDYIHDRDGDVTFLPIEQPPSKFKSFLDIFEKQLEHEKYVTAAIHKLYDLALKEKDYPSQIMLQWFIEEQVEDQKLGALAPGQEEKA
jgi:ferritin